MRLLPTLLALAVAAGALSAAPATASVSLASPSAPGAASAATVAEEGAEGVSIDVVPRQDGTIVAGSDLTIAVRLANDSAAETAEGTATVTLARIPVDSREDLDAWLLDGGADAATDLSEYRGTDIVQLDTPGVTAGGSVVLPDTVVPAASLPFTAERAGVYLLAVSLSAADGTTAVSHSAVTVRGATSPPSARVAVAMPMTVPAGAGGLISAEDLESYTVTGGLLDRQLSEASGLPVTIGIDPRVIASIRVLGDTAPQPALDWLDRLRAMPNDTFALGYADTDIAATSQAAGIVLAPTSIAVDPAVFVATGTDGEQTPTPVPSPSSSGGVPTLDDLLAWDYSLAGIAWPTDDTVVAADLDTFAASGLQTTIVSSSNVSFPATGAPPASGTSGGHRIVSADDTVSTLLRAAVAAPTLAEWQADVARLAAALAGLAEQSGAQDRIALATLGRDTPGIQFRLASTIAAVSGSGLAITSSFSDTISQTPADAAIVDSPEPAERTARFAELFASEGATAQFATVLDDPTRITGERRLSLLAVSSQSWAGEPELWSTATADYLGTGSEILSSVVVASTNLVQTSDRNPLPIVVTNALDYPVTVTVEVTALRPIVRITDPSVEVTVPANSQKRASIAAESIANGEVRLTIALFSTARVPISAPSIIEVTVNAGWETTATSILAVLVVAVFILGIIRTVRRRRRIAKGELEDDRGPHVSDLNDPVPGRDA